jgi:very-short-patch-repair endonuclease
VRTAQQIRDRQRTLRAQPTSAETVLWDALVERWPNKKRRIRQPIIGYYIADFAFPHRCLIVEVDGPIHVYRQAHDDRRDAFMRECGFTVLRFSNEAVFADPQAVIRAICAVKPRDFPLTWQRALGIARYKARNGREAASRKARQERAGQCV